MTNDQKIKVLLQNKHMKMEILTPEIMDKLLIKKSIIYPGATSITYKVCNIYTNKGFLCLKIIKNSVFKQMNETTAEKKQSKSIWNEEEEDIEDQTHEEEIQINFDLIKQLYLEYEMLNNLNHPNIIKAYGFFYGDKNNDPAILLEYCKFNLEQVIKDLDDIYLVGIIYEICSAMRYVHAKKIIHRDLKMKNILINLKKHVKICDFGISKVMDLTTQTSMTHGIGTIPFMAPELFEIDAKYNEKVDVFAFGVIMFYILPNGQTPKYSVPGHYEGIEFPSRINELSRQIIKQCLMTLPNERPSFKQILKMITINDFLLIDGIENDISILKKHLELE